MRRGDSGRSGVGEGRLGSCAHPGAAAAGQAAALCGGWRFGAAVSALCAPETAQVVLEAAHGSRRVGPRSNSSPPASSLRSPAPLKGLQ